MDFEGIEKVRQRVRQNGTLAMQLAVLQSRLTAQEQPGKAAVTGPADNLSGVAAADADQSFIFHITGNGTDMYVTIKGNGSVTIKNLKVGTYKVEEVTSWSWRYTPADGVQSVSILNGQTNSVTFVNNRTNDNWLSAESSAVNKTGGRVS